MAYISDADIVKMVSQYCGITQNVIDDIRKAECLITEKLLKSGNQISYGSLGKFRLKEHSPQEARDMKLPSTGEIKHLEAKPAYQSPDFLFARKLKAEIREKTEDNLI